MNQKFTVSGTLSTQGTTATLLVNRLVYLEALNTGDGGWFRISANANTRAGGAYAFTGYISQTGTYYLWAHFDGTTTYAGCVSDPVTVYVGVQNG